MAEQAGDNNGQNSETNAILGVLAQSRRLQNKRRTLYNQAAAAATNDYGGRQ